jgi:ATP-dependent exoDNAse (exonuclease V) beta subunit
LLETLDFFLKEPDAPIAGHKEEARIAELQAAVQFALERLMRLLEKNAVTTDKRFGARMETVGRGLQQSNKHLYEALDSPYLKKALLEDCLVKASKGAVTEEMEAAYALLKENAAAYRMEEPLLRRALVLAALFKPAKLLAEELLLQQRRLGTLFSAFWAPMVLKAWEGENGVPEAFFRMGTRLTHMLVDEFQDTSREQWQALEPLAEECLAKGGGLTIVGDVKQAIYGWRGGDVALFHDAPEALQHLCEDGVVKQVLPFNRRSRQVLVDFNNAFFSPLAHEERAKALAEAVFDPGSFSARRLTELLQRSFADAGQKLPPGKDVSGGSVHLKRFEAMKSDARKETVLWETRELILDVLKRRPPSDIAVLVRSNEQAKDTAEYLIAAGIPVVTENSLNIAEHPLVRSLVAFLAFLDAPLDDAAFWEWINSDKPFKELTGITRESLAAWAVRRAQGPLYKAFKADFPDAWENIIAPFYGGAGLSSAYDLTAEMVRLFGLCDRYPEDELFLARFLEVVHRAETAGYGTAATFLEYWQQQGVEAKVPLPEGLNAVRIMTIHKSKGLQFPVVVVPFHDFPMQVGQSPVVVDVGSGPISTQPLREMGELYESLELERLMEQFHTLYVAWTRPEEELYCFFAPSKSSKPLQKALDFLLDGLFDEDSEVFQVGEAPQGEGAAELETAPPCLPPCALPIESPLERPMSWLPRLAVRRRFDTREYEERLLSPTPVMAEKERGTLVHAAVDVFIKGAPAGLGPEQAVDAVTASAPYILPDESSFKREALEALEWLASLPDFPLWIEKGEPERSILTANGEVLRPDLLVFGDDDPHIIEFKTGRPAAEHEKQLRRYMRTMAEALPQAKVTGALAYLDEHRLVPLSQEEGMGEER